MFKRVSMLACRYLDVQDSVSRMETSLSADLDLTDLVDNDGPASITTKAPPKVVPKEPKSTKAPTKPKTKPGETRTQTETQTGQRTDEN